MDLCTGAFLGRGSQAEWMVGGIWIFVYVVWLSVPGSMSVRLGLGEGSVSCLCGSVSRCSRSCMSVCV